ncbi:MAG: hypothetical protein MI924_33770 [Chloroflexales bacterium]|nr:hypothetical protein [Chloroflexales bacterium]
MDRDDCIMTGYCLVCEHAHVIRTTCPVRRGGGAPARTDQALVTMESCGEYVTCATDQDRADDVRAPYRAWFPHRTDRPLVVRHAANRWHVKAAIQQRLTVVRGHAANPVQVIATLPLPVCGGTRAPRARCFLLEADDGSCAVPALHADGSCAAPALHADGVKLGWRIAGAGRLPAAPRAGLGGIAPADQGVREAARPALLAERPGGLAVMPPRKGMAARYHPQRLKAGQRRRIWGATVGAQWSERFAVARVRGRDRWPYHQRLGDGLITRRSCTLGL